MKDYQFKKEPSLMQKLSVIQLKKHRVFANWCGTGAGKTLSALLASRELNSRVVVIICPEDTKNGWKDTINAAYPNNSNPIIYNNINQIEKFDKNRFNYIIINYEKFSSNTKNLGKTLVDKLLSLNKIDFICFDEIKSS